MGVVGVMEDDLVHHTRFQRPSVLESSSSDEILMLVSAGCVLCEGRGLDRAYTKV